MSVASAVTSNVNFRYFTSLSGRVLRTESVDAGTSQALTDIEGRVVWQQDARGTEQRYEYDTLGRPLKRTETLKDAGAKVQETWTYGEKAANDKSYNLRGQVLKHVDPAGTLDYTSIGYGLDGAPLGQTRKVTGDSTAYTTRWQRDAHGRQLYQQDAKEHEQYIAHDVAGRQKKLELLRRGESTKQTLISEILYGAAGQKLREKAGNGVLSEYSYEPQTQRLKTIVSTRTATGSTTKTLQRLSYSYDPVGNITAIDDTAIPTSYFRNQRTDGTKTFAYDTLYQLITARGRENATSTSASQRWGVIASTDPVSYVNYTRSYEYDRGGNLNKIIHNGGVNNGYTRQLTMAASSNRVASLTEGSITTSLSCDASGNQLKLDHGPALTWNGLNQLSGATVVKRDSGNDEETYVYGGDGMRVAKTSTSRASGSTNQQQVLYLPGLEIRTTKNESNTNEQLEVIVAGQFRVLHWTTGGPTDIDNGQLRHSLTDHLGSSQIELDTDGKILSQEEYYPYGGTAVMTAESQTEAKYKTIRYSGKERDATGLYYYGFRYYQPWLGRWLNPDPAGTVDGLNLFRMVRNNPVLLHDPNGLAGDRHPESEGESESEDNTIVYRALRSNENPQQHGLVPPAGSNPSLSAAAHIQAGSRATVKSTWVSTTRSIRTAAAWAAQNGYGRVAKIKIPEEMPREYVHDLTTETGQADVFGDKKPLGLNFAKSSKEVVLKGGVPPAAVVAVYDVERISEKQYAGRSEIDGAKYSKSRSLKSINKVRASPYPVRLTEMHSLDEISFLKSLPGKTNWRLTDFHVDYTGQARQFYNSLNKYERGMIKKSIGSPYQLDDIKDAAGYQSYMQEAKTQVAYLRRHLTGSVA